MFIATGLNCAGLMVLLTKPAEADSVICLPLHDGDAMAVKSPASIAAVGAKLVFVAGLLRSTVP